MGVIQRQSIKHSIVQYAGIAVGVLSQLYLYPKVIEAYGLAIGLLSAALFLAPLTSLGSQVLAVRYFPIFKNKENAHNGFLGLLLTVAGIGCLIFALAFPAIRSVISEHLFNSDKSPWYAEFLPYILPLTILLVFNRLLGVYASNFQRIVVPSILEEFLIKITLPLLLLSYWMQWIPVQWVVNGILFNYCFVTGGLLFYLYFLGQLNPVPQFKFVSKKLRKEMSSYAGYGVLNSLGAQGAFKIDTLMVTAYTNLASTGIFGQANFFSEAMSKPRKSIIGISQPLIAKAIQENDMDEVEKIYKKSSLTLLIFGLFLFLGLWACIDDLFAIMNKPEMAAGKYVVLLLCMARLLNMSAGVNNEIINNSPYYRISFYTYLVLAGLNIALNIWLIPKFGITGAAVATLSSFTVFEIIKILVVKLKFNLFPYTRKTLLVLVLGTACYAFTLPLPDLSSPYLNIIVKAVLLTLTFPVLVYTLKISEDFNQLINKGIKEIFKRKVSQS